MTEPLLEVEGLTTQLGDEASPSRVVDGLDLQIASGETFALLGESGCGKSMTALSLMRLLPPGGRILSGGVRFAGTDLLRLTEAEMRRVRGGGMAMIFQEPQTSLNPVLTVGAQIAEAVRVHEGISQARIRERVVDLLRSVGISEPERRVEAYPHQLSGGMKQRVMIAMALAGDPRLLIADEPTTALDVTIQAQVLSLIKDLRRETGMAVLLITHDLGVVAETADRLAVMYAGQIVETAEVAEFFAGPAHPYSRKLMESLPSAEKRHGRLAMISGRVPTLDQAFQGCRFADRCDSVMPICRETVPEWHLLERGRRVRCHLWDTDVPPAFETSVDDESASGHSGVAAMSRDEAREPLLRAIDLKVHFPIHRGLFRRVVGQVKAVDGLSLDLHSGRTLALVGESGCGKTTAGKGILQLIRPTGGSVLYRDRDLVGLGHRKMRAYRKELQVIFQDPYASMNPRMLVGDVVGEGLQALGIEPSRAGRARRVAELLELVGMDPEAARRYPHEFSGGQRQRICIARALAVEPRLIVCDEPTSALDVSVQAQILNLLKDLQVRLGLSYLFITHNIAVVAYLAQEVAVMYLGRVVERGSVDEVLDDPRHPYTRALFSAVPSVAPGKRRAVIRLEGDMPSPSHPPQGCHFHPRCPLASSECARAYPPEIGLSDSHSARCFHLD
ncbi:oligopeptide/dipeptide ABC transporter, ATPase subunit [Thiorhodococcus drewsii AZ1]|uniref:ABC-type dipeptide transporter n=1 Tax=Thiorhodococcus drewsii AZ1 TaxID=765913 RepID=G2DZ60_9GAMM|nr:ABC transporter ATP-binding protein [Thiorhodococcus drewsii]EGV32414.1 oligopeptide/dipeptide ABC transporter, ATPase subunit [Thiorhodococcus drewsii AZ1]